MSQSADDNNTSFLGRKQWLIYGYLRCIEDEMQVRIPEDIKQLVISCYPTKLQIIGIGKNFKGEFGLGHETTVDQLRALPTLSCIVRHPQHIYCGRHRYLMQTLHNNEVYAVGCNVYNECGKESKSYGDSIVNVTRMDHGFAAYEHVNTMSTGLNSQHTIICTNVATMDKHRFYIVGHNNSGQLSYKRCSLVPQLTHNTVLDSIFEKEEIVKITCGAMFTLFLTKRGSVFSCGDNRTGQCGINTDSNCAPTPVQIPFLYHVEDICSGDWHNLAITRRTNELYVWGSNSFGQLGISSNDGTEEEEDRPRNELFVADVAMKNIFFANMKIVSISCGSCYSLCINAEGECFLFGNNNSGQIGNGKYDKVHGVYRPFRVQDHSRLKRVRFENACCGDNHTLFVTRENTVYACGNNEYSQCTNKVELNKIVIPRLLSKTEIGIKKNQKIQRVIAGFQTTVIICEDSV